VSQLAGFLGNHVKRRRKALKFSQEALAEKTGLSVPSLSEIERGIANPTLLTLEKIAAALGISVAGLLDTEGRPNIPPEELKKRVSEQLGKMREEQLQLVAGLLDISLK
jgi:transcriptional regulator with XRE-family HTH domain